MSIAFPGYVPDVHTADALDPAWGNALRDRALQVFTTKALRDAAITVPQVGQAGIITAAAVAGTEGIYTYVGATDGWVAPWNLPWGEVARTVSNSNQTNADASEHTITGAATTFTAVANRKYRITVTLIFRNLATANASITFKTKDGSTLIEQARVQAAVGTTLAGTADFSTSWEVETTLTAGSHTINVTAQSANAAGYTVTGASSPVTITVDDIGPSGAPA